MTSRRSTADRTGTRILDVAERLLQTKGFNGFSYADIADELGMTKASLHYHFASKAQLGYTLVCRYTSNFETALGKISSSSTEARASLRHYVKLYTDVLAGDRMCLCGIVAAEYDTLPGEMQTAIHQFFELNERWLAAVLEQGSREGSLALQAPAIEEARMLVGSLEGAMLVARTYRNRHRFESAAKLLLAQLEPDRTLHGTRSRTTKTGGRTR